MLTKTIPLIVVIFLLFECSCMRTQSAVPARPAVALDTILACANNPIIAKAFTIDLATMRQAAAANSELKSKSQVNPDPPASIRDAGLNVYKSADDGSQLRFWINNFSRTPGAYYCADALRGVEYSSDSATSLPKTVTLDGVHFDFDANSVFLRAQEFRFESGEVRDDSRSYPHTYFQAKNGRVTLRFLPTERLVLDGVFIDRAN